MCERDVHPLAWHFELAAEAARGWDKEKRKKVTRGAWKSLFQPAHHSHRSQDIPVGSSKVRCHAGSAAFPLHPEMPGHELVFVAPLPAVPSLTAAS